jgi:hypothetical protein
MAKDKRVPQTCRNYEKQKGESVEEECHGE